MRIVARKPVATLRRRIARTEGFRREYDAAKRYLSAGELAIGRLDRQKVPQSWAQLSRPDPRRQHGPHASGRQIRIRTRLQILDVRDMVDSPSDHACNRRPKPHDPCPCTHDRHDEQSSPVDSGDGPRSWAANRLRKSYPNEPTCRSTMRAASCGWLGSRCRWINQWATTTTATSATS